MILVSKDETLCVVSLFVCQGVLFVCTYKNTRGTSAAVVMKIKPRHLSLTQRQSKACLHAVDDVMSEVLSVDAVLFGLLVFSGILGNVLVIYVVR